MPIASASRRAGSMVRTSTRGRGRRSRRRSRRRSSSCRRRRRRSTRSPSCCARAGRRTSSRRGAREHVGRPASSCDSLHRHERRHLLGETRTVEPDVLQRDDRDRHLPTQPRRARRARDRSARASVRRASARGRSSIARTAARSSSLNGSNGTRLTMTCASGMSWSWMPLHELERLAHGERLGERDDDGAGSRVIGEQIEALAHGSRDRARGNDAQERRGDLRERERVPGRGEVDDDELVLVRAVPVLARGRDRAAGRARPSRGTSAPPRGSDGWRPSASRRRRGASSAGRRGGSACARGAARASTAFRFGATLTGSMSRCSTPSASASAELAAGSPTISAQRTRLPWLAA